MDPPTSCPSSPLSPLPSLSSSPLSSLHDSLFRSEISDPAGRYPSPMSTVASGPQPSPKCPAIVVADHPVDELKLDSQTGPEPGSPQRKLTVEHRPRKPRKTPEPKPRRTEHLDLTKPDAQVTAHDHIQMERLATLLRKKKKIVVIAGAGISVSAGIPDFRSSSGLFARAKSQHNLKGSGTQLFDASVYKHDSSTESFHTMVREMADMSRRAEPTPFHHLLASLSQEGRLLRLYSQNIDCLDTNMKPLETKVPLPSRGPWPTTIQLHGGLQKMVCSKCHQLEPFQSELFDGPEAPLCNACRVDDEVRTAHAGKRSHGIGRLRPRFVLYNEFNPDGEAIGNVSAADLKTRPDAVIVVGTTLKVPGTRRLAKEMCQVARGRRDGLTVWINLEPEPKGVELKDCWDIVVRAKCDDVARLVALPSWDCDIGSDYLVSKDQDASEMGKSTIEINVPSSPVKAERTVNILAAIPTPHASPKPAARSRTKGQARGRPRKQPAESKETKTTTTTTKQAQTKQIKKQTTISFAQTAEAATEAAPEPAKKPARKPRQPAKSRAPPKKAAILAFTTVTKSNVMADSKPSKDLDAYAATPYPVPSSPTPPASRKRSREASTSPLEQQQEHQQQRNSLCKRQMIETISPKTVPRGLRRFID
ncbi:NAD-dependent protein deacetylase hst4 [Escovopsis weberi]|uniref:NAD-dependent protein deacetylase hst4 n=1 Tax=Escovopsis weberi TaxID=150374 RepID=A0A0M9VTR2_ESCWE|nr:NAD-dependent protein deacetylase hst4 [Escovopsis weberi]